MKKSKTNQKRYSLPVMADKPLILLDGSVNRGLNREKEGCC
jgi:hypothetical protein